MTKKQAFCLYFMIFILALSTSLMGLADAASRVWAEEGLELEISGEGQVALSQALTLDINDTDEDQSASFAVGQSPNSILEEENPLLSGESNLLSEDSNLLSGESNLLSEENALLSGENALLSEESLTKLTAIYLDGQKGNDENDGSLGKPVQTFARAKALATENSTVEKIIVTGTVPIEGDISLADTQAQIVRASDFPGYLLQVKSNQTATLSHIVIDGNSEANIAQKSLIELQNGSTLNITDGAILQNNKITEISNTATQGGAIYAYASTINMSGGSISGNRAVYGGGICLSASTMNFSGGIVSGNYAPRCIDTSVTPTQYYSAGGGILASNGSTLNMSEGAQVTGNRADEIGGGISLGGNQVTPSNILNMTGGIIAENVAGAAGGGIFVQAQYYSGGPSKAYISGGSITNNVMDGSGVTEKAFGGGGIYVNGANNNYGVNGANGELYLTNAIITDNTSQWEGAGYAACPISKTTIFVTDGVAIYDNHSQDIGRELYILCSYAYGFHSGDPEYDLSQRMLGGVPYNWRKTDGTLLEVDKYKGKLTNYDQLALYTEEKGNTLTQGLATVTISGNSSTTRGGGIGSNGTVVMGTEGQTQDISVTKQWSDPNKTLDQVTLYLKADGIIVDSTLLNASNNWTYTFEGLPQTNKGNTIVYTVEEEALDGFDGRVELDGEGGFTITNSPKPTEPTEPTKPTQPTQPTQPTEPTEPTKPTEPTQPMEPTEPTKPTEPTQPTEPTTPTQPTAPTTPTQPSQPTPNGPPPIKVGAYVQLPHTGSADMTLGQVISLTSALAGAFLLLGLLKHKKTL